MNILIIPATNDVPWYRFKITLSNIVYTLRFRYNTRSERWILDIADASNNDVVNGLPILIERDISGQYVLAGLPEGTLFATDDTNQKTQPTRYSFGTDHTLWYADPTQEAPII